LPLDLSNSRSPLVLVSIDILLEGLVLISRPGDFEPSLLEPDWFGTVSKSFSILIRTRANIKGGLIQADLKYSSGYLWTVLRSAKEIEKNLILILLEKSTCVQNINKDYNLILNANLSYGKE
jgi:hypothetical protein